MIEDLDKTRTTDTQIHFAALIVLAVGLAALCAAVIAGCSGGGGGGGGGGPSWHTFVVETSEGDLWVQSRRSRLTDADYETIRRRVRETWRDLRRLTAPTSDIAEIFRPQHVLVRELPGSNGAYGGTTLFQGRYVHLAITGSNWISLNHEVHDHSACHFDRQQQLGLVPPQVDCRTVGHPGGLQLDGMPVRGRIEGFEGLIDE